MTLLRHHRHGREHGDAGLAHRQHVRARPHHVEKLDQVLDIFVEAEAAAVSGTSRALCQSVMKTSCSGSMVRTVARNSVAKWPDNGATSSTRGCAVAMSFLKCSKRTERRAGGGLLAHLDFAVADSDGANAERRARMGEAGARNQLIGGGEIAKTPDGRRAIGWPPAASAMVAQARTGTMISEWV